MILKFDAVLSDLAQFRERENLISAAIRQNWSIPIHEFVQAAKMFDHIQSRPNKKMIGISKNDLRLEFMQLSRRDGFHRPLRPHRHKRRRLDYAVQCSYSPTSRFRLSILRKKLEHCGVSFAQWLGSARGSQSQKLFVPGERFLVSRVKQAEEMPKRRTKRAAIRKKKSRK